MDARVSALPNVLTLVRKAFSLPDWSLAHVSGEPVGWHSPTGAERLRIPSSILHAGRWWPQAGFHQTTIGTPRWIGFHQTTMANTFRGQPAYFCPFLGLWPFTKLSIKVYPISALCHRGIHSSRGAAPLELHLGLGERAGCSHFPFPFLSWQKGSLNVFHCGRLQGIYPTAIGPELRYVHTTAATTAHKEQTALPMSFHPCLSV